MNPGPDLQLRRAQASTWLEVAFGDRPGWAALAFGIGPYRTAQGRYAHRDWRELFYRWPAHGNALLTDVAGMLADVSAGEPMVDVFVCPHLRTIASRKGDTVLPPTSLHADLDRPTTAPQLWDELAPLRVASGSPGHEHRLIMLDEPVEDLQRWAQLQRALRTATGGDDKVAHNDLLRLPGTWNAKLRPPVPVTLRAGWPGRLWTVAELAERLGVDLSSPLPGPAPAPAHPPRPVAVPDELPDSVRHAAQAFARAPDKSAQWSRLIYRAAGARMSRDAAFAVAEQFGLPHLPRYRGREAEEFDRVWAKTGRWLAEARARRTVPEPAPPSRDG